MNCAHCGNPHGRTTGEINRARSAGFRLFCSRKCFGLDRRIYKPKSQKVEEKRLYDIAYREKNIDSIKARKREYFKQTYDPKAAAIVRKGRMAEHIEYCRRPEYRTWKRQYDQQYRARNDYGPFWESGMLLAELSNEIEQRSTFYERAVAKGNLNKSLQRKRDYEKLINGR